MPWENPKRTAHLSIASLWHQLLLGNYPELVVEPERGFRLWHGSYIQTYFERDVRLVRQIGDLAIFQNFLRSLAARSGQLINLSDISHHLGAAVNTLKTWLSVLEASHQVVVLRSYFANVGKAAYAQYLEPLKSQISYDKSEYVSPKVALYGKTAVLTYNYHSLKKKPDGQFERTSFWNTTEVYRLIGDEWKITNTHWSYYQFLSTTLDLDGTIRSRTHWNCTEVYAKTPGGWKIVHTHWSFIKGWRKDGGV